MYSNRQVFLILCVSLNFVNIDSGTNKKPWIQDGPNFDPEYPQFTPFNNNEFINFENQLKIQTESTVNDELPNDPFEKDSNKQLSVPYLEPVSEPNLQDRLKPFKNLVLGLYQNYRNSYVGNNKTINVQQIEELENKIEDTEKPKRVRAKKKSKKKSNIPVVVPPADFDEVKYNVGPGVNLSIDRDKEMVNVYLDEDCLKDVFTGRGKKYDLISKILPLFILPFLIQSAIVPFVVSTLKLFLLKSIVVGKIAIFLLIVSAFRNHVKYNYEVPPSYYVDPPSRRSESSTGPGYRVEGKPTTWVN